MKKQYIGENEVTGVFEQDNDCVKLTFKDHPEMTLKNSLYKMLVKDKGTKGKNVQDQVNAIFALKFLTELADNGLTAHTAQGVAFAIQTLLSNLTNEAIAKKFNVTHSDNIMLCDVIDKVDNRPDGE